MKIIEKIKDVLPISGKKARDLVKDAYESAWHEAKKWYNNANEFEKEARRSGDGGFEWGVQQVDSGFIKPTKHNSDKRKNIRESLKEINKNLVITNEKIENWRSSGYFNTLEAEQYDSREQSDMELAAAQDASYITTFTDPHYKAMLFNTTNYIIGGGLRFSVPNAKVQEYLVGFWRRNRMDIKQTKMVFSTLQLGEYFNGLFIEEKGKHRGEVTLRNYRTYEINDIEVGKKDRDTYLSYEYLKSGIFTNSQKEYIADYQYFNQYDDSWSYKEVSENHGELNRNKLIMFMRYNMGDEVRGRVPYGGALKYLRMGRDFVFDRFLLNHERGRVLWIEKVSRMNQSRYKEYKPSPYASTTDLPYGKILRVFDGGEIDVVNANIDGADSLPDYLNILYMAAADAQVPLIIIDQRASEEVYASMKRSANPFHQMVESQRTFYGYYFGELLRFAIVQGVKAGKLPKTIDMYKYEPFSSEKKNPITKERVDTTLIPIEVIWPEVFTEDPLNQARADALYLDRKVMSRETVANRNKLDYAEEVTKMKQYEEFMDEPDKNKDDKSKDKDNGKPARVGVGELLGDWKDEVDLKIEELENKFNKKINKR